MRIVIPTIGSRGDVQPYIALAQKLAQRGHDATLASHPVMRTLVESHGVTFVPIGPDIDLAREVAAIRGRARVAALGLIKAMSFGFDMLERSHDDIMALCREADLVVVPTAIAAGKNEAELLDRPYVSVTLMPWAIPWDDPGRPLLKRAAYGAIDWAISLMTTAPLNRIRKRQGLPPVGKEGFTSPRLNLVPVSPAVYPPNPHWDRCHRMVGFWFATAPADWQPPADLLAFLEAGEPPLLVTLGSMYLGDGDAQATAALFVESIAQTGTRAIVQGWQADMQRLPLTPGVFGIGALPHDWLMPRCAAVVHHGGFGTTSAGLRAGIPALLIPHVADQYYWGQHLRQLGVSPAPIPLPKLTREGLIAGLAELAHNRELRTKASALGERIRAENGLDNAVDLIENLKLPDTVQA